MRFRMCKDCLSYSKRLERCKLKKELINSNGRGKCAVFSKIPQTLINRYKNQDKNARKKKAAKTCIGCESNKEGFCDKYKRWAFNARARCLEEKQS